MLSPWPFAVLSAPERTLRVATYIFFAMLELQTLSLSITESYWIMAQYNSFCIEKIQNKVSAQLKKFCK